MFESLRTHQIKPQGTKSLLPISSRLFCFQTDCFSARGNSAPWPGVVCRQHHRLAAWGPRPRCPPSTGGNGCVFARTTACSFRRQPAREHAIRHAMVTRQCYRRAPFFRTMNPGTYSSRTCSSRATTLLAKQLQTNVLRSGTNRPHRYTLSYK